MKMNLQTVALGLVVFLLTKPALAGSYEDAVAAYTRRIYTTAQQLWRQLAGQARRSDSFSATDAGRLCSRLLTDERTRS